MSIDNVFRNHYAKFSGRTRRREDWMFTLISTVISLVLSIPLLIGSLSMSANGEADAPNGLFILGALLLGIYGLAVFVPTLALTIRRLHDTGKSGWFYLLAFIPLGNLVLLVFTVLDSEPGANKWGANPKGLGNTAPAPANW